MTMDSDDRRILENEVARTVGTAVSRWMKKNGIEEDVTVNAMVVRPTLYVDETGISHCGPLAVVNVTIADDEDDDDEY